MIDFNVVKERAFLLLKNENVHGKYYQVSLRKKKIMPFKVLKNILFVGAMITFISAFVLSENHQVLSFFITMIYMIVVFFLIFKNILGRFKREKEYEKILKSFVYKNDFFETYSNGDIKSELSLGYLEDKEKGELLVVAFKDGDRYQEIAEKLANKLESALDLQFYRMNSMPTYVEYIFRIIPVERYVVDKLPYENSDMTVKIYDEQEISLKQNFNILLSGSSGSGKSYLSYRLWADLCSKYVVREGKQYHSKVYVIDPKMSDLYKHCSMANYPKNMYGTDVKDAFRMIKEFTEELEKRKEIYANINEFDKVLLDLGYEPQILLIDEYPSLVAQMESKQLKDWEKLLGNISRLGRQLSMGIILIMQQAGAGDNGLPTAIREQLVNKVFMGNSETISQQSAEMVFGTSKKNLPSPLNAVGEGIISIEGREPVSFLAPVFIDKVDKVIQPVLTNAAFNWNNNIEGDKLEKIEKKSVVDTKDWEKYL